MLVNPLFLAMTEIHLYFLLTRPPSAFQNHPSLLVATSCCCVAAISVWQCHCHLRPRHDLVESKCSHHCVGKLSCEHATGAFLDHNWSDDVSTTIQVCKERARWA